MSDAKPLSAEEEQELRHAVEQSGALYIGLREAMSLLATLDAVRARLAAAEAACAQMRAAMLRARKSLALLSVNDRELFDAIDAALAPDSGAALLAVVRTVGRWVDEGHKEPGSLAEQDAFAAIESTWDALPAELRAARGAGR